MKSNAWMRNPWMWFLMWIPVQMVLVVASIATHNFSLLFQGIGLGMAVFLIAVVVSLVAFFRKAGASAAQIVMMGASASRRFTGHGDGGGAGHGAGHRMSGEE